MFLAVKILVPGETGNGIGQMLSLRRPKSGMCNKSLSLLLLSVFWLTNFYNIFNSIPICIRFC